MMMVKMQVESEGVAVISMCNPPVNALTLQGLAELKNKYMEAMERDDVKAIILMGDGGKFSGGLDINVMRTMQETGDVSVVTNMSRDLVINVIEDGKKPSVAAVQGYALGGGLELAMACSARLATPEAKLGLPELTFGVIPGCGGTQRLPRLVGVSKAVNMLMSSESIMSEEGKEIGLIDEVVSAQELLRVSLAWALDIVEGRKSRTNSLSKTDRLASMSDLHALFNTETAMPHHKACLDVVRYGIVSGGYCGLSKEQKLFEELVLSNTAKASVHLHFAQRATSEVAGITDVGLTPRKMKRVGVIGGGLMGSCIATALILANINVILKEINTEYLQKAITKIQANLEGLLRKGKLGHDEVVKSLSMLKGVSDYSDFKELDMTIEAVYEEVSLKQSVFEEVEKNCPDHCILASTTSSIDLNIIGNKTKSQDRIVGAHFFSPAHIMPLLEIIPTEKTSAQVVVDLITVGKELKKVPLVVKNCPAFAVNRTFFPYTQAAYFLADLGIDIFRIDKVITTFGMPMGPFQFHDITGYGIALAANKEIDKAFSDRTYISPLLDLIVSSGRTGKSNGKGYYLYEKRGNPPIPDLSVLPIVEESRRKMNIIPQGQCVMTLSDQEIVEMVFFPVVNEACRVIDEGVVAKASDLDVASVLGMKFPSHLGGIIFWGDMIGPKYIHESLTKWEKMYGGFFKPSNYLAERAARGKLLSDPAPSP
ncbi:peroxisomal fatty acid beta-oxidation multifunctional protein-like [Neltuma alba]|uniref:peroxisomal fatty acid beta-oxidation multifunctional protein-like n=1 Tax=Neltuma alba TaxID=207710 RepID=UPI0010A548F1|nr:peroxisomal fatty acid beta-oxidation multifunctional protein-like [Prosopis alba]